MEVVTQAATNAQEATQTLTARIASLLLTAMEGLVFLPVLLSTTKLLPPLPRLVELVTPIVTNAQEATQTLTARIASLLLTAMEGLVFLPVLLSTTKLPTHLLKLVELVTVIATSVQEETPTFIAPTVSQLLSAMEELVSPSVPLSTTRLLPPLPRLVEPATPIVTSVLEIRTTIV